MLQGYWLFRSEVESCKVPSTGRRCPLAMMVTGECRFSKLLPRIPRAEFIPSPHVLLLRNVYCWPLLNNLDRLAGCSCGMEWCSQCTHRDNLDRLPCLLLGILTEGVLSCGRNGRCSLCKDSQCSVRTHRL